MKNTKEGGAGKIWCFVKRRRSEKSEAELENNYQGTCDYCIADIE